MTISLLMMLAVMTIGMLSHSVVTTRRSGVEGVRSEAYANARLGLMLALAELQRTAGDDRRITADGSLAGTAPSASHVTGVWESWTPEFREDPTRTAPDYEEVKEDHFMGWLVSNQDREAVERLDWADDGSLENPELLFSETHDGFEVTGGRVPVGSPERPGSYAWAVVQEATKAKLTVAGEEEAGENAFLAAQERPGLGLSEAFAEPTGEWESRSAKITGFQQLRLDDEIWQGAGSVAGGADFTTQGMGLLTDVLRGGLKVDLSLGFEMDEADFAKETWSDAGESFANPFLAGAEELFGVPAAYGEQRPLFSPLANRGALKNNALGNLLKVEYDFPVAGVPTFHYLRSFYRIPRHLYVSADGVTAFERAGDHVASAAQAPTAGWTHPPGKSVDGEASTPSIRPVVDRVMYLISAAKGDGDLLQYVVTPVVTLWNPYNVALEIEGAVAYIWGDIPYRIGWRVYNESGTKVFEKNTPVSTSIGQGRSAEPYFFAAITATGSALPAGGGGPSIRFQPGEVRVFMPAQPEASKLEVGGSVRERTVFLRPVESLADYSTEGGFLLPTRNPQGSHDSGYERKLAPNERGEMFMFASTVQDHPFFMSLEDATRAKGATANERGQYLADVLSRAFTISGETAQFRSPRLSYGQLASPVPVGVIETYHRVARSGSGTQYADLVFTGNPRQPWMNDMVGGGGGFKTGPQYQTRMRTLSSFNELMETESSGRRSYYGASHTSAGGRGNLSFFEIPREPLLSLASLQHLEFSPTPFSAAQVFANSWASAYVPRERVATGVLAVDHGYLANEALWDAYFFSGASARMEPVAATGASDHWDRTVARVDEEAGTVIRNFVQDPVAHPLANPRMRLHLGGQGRSSLADGLASEAGPVKVAAHLLVDGAFNVNSTKLEAWKALLSGSRGRDFLKANGDAESADGTAFPRFRHPTGNPDDIWDGFRVLSDEEITSLAEKLVAEVKKRGPFLSLAEFVNRRVEDSDLGLKGALQAAIDEAGLNAGSLQESFSTTKYPAESRENIEPADTAV
ncbi:MAG: hypothetical protein ACQKBY_08515, partial [Verrucomicrobiales bacterium]